MHTSIFSFSFNDFYLSQNKILIFDDIYFIVCKYFEFGFV